MSAPVASETRSPLRASSEISACSAGGPRAGGNQQCVEFTAVQAHGVGLIIQPGPPYIRGGRSPLIMVNPG